MPQTIDAFSVGYPVKYPGVGMGEQGDELERGCAPQGPWVLKQSLIKPSQEWKCKHKVALRTKPSSSF